MQNFRNLRVWQQAHELALLTYRITADFPREETFGLRATLRKTSIDIPACIAEGSMKPSDAEFFKSLSAALALGSRLEYYALLSRDLTFLGAQVHAEYEEAIVSVKKMLNGFRGQLGAHLP